MPTFETSSRLELQEIAQALSHKFYQHSPEDLLLMLIQQEFPGRIGLVSSFGTEAAVLLHMVAQIDPSIPIIFLDTKKHFTETIDYRDQLISDLGLLNVQSVTPRCEAIRADDPNGILFKSNPDLCCHVRKTVPLVSSLQPLDCWITGRKRVQADTRSELTLFDTQEKWLKVNPLINWNVADVESYFRTHNLRNHPLKSKGYLSVGCAPCTRAVLPGEDSRAGRWADSNKTECGIHFENGKLIRR